MANFSGHVNWRFVCLSFRIDWEMSLLLRLENIHWLTSVLLHFSRQIPFWPTRGSPLCLLFCSSQSLCRLEKLNWIRGVKLICNSRFLHKKGSCTLFIILTLSYLVIDAIFGEKTSDKWLKFAPVCVMRSLELKLLLFSYTLLILFI